MKNGVVSKIWAGKLMPSILRGSKEHNAKLKAQHAEVVCSEALPVERKEEEKVTALAFLEATASNPEVKMLLGRAEKLVKAYETVSQAATSDLDKKAKSPATSSAAVRSILYCDESLDLSPPNSSSKAAPVIHKVLSPFSKAKQRASQNGIGLSDECRDMYSITELHSRMDFLVKANEKWRGKRQHKK